VPTVPPVPTVPTIDLVIFDCDGVLVDSERLIVRTEAAILSRLGWPLTPEEVIDRFVGRSAPYMHHEVERHLGRPIDWHAEFESAYEEVFAAELTPVPGVVEALDRIEDAGIPTCVASSGSHQRMRLTLGLTGLYQRFEGRIFSADEVAHGKPAPDIFLHAAERMGRATSPRRCAVIEDSVSGVEAAVAAGMRVFAYSGGVTSADKLARPVGGATLFEHMAALPDLIVGTKPNLSPEKEKGSPGGRRSLLETHQELEGGSAPVV
jgi:HAD superfamily hydrolase (TIGR01509 family)